MEMEAVELIQLDFDNMENRGNLIIKRLGIFTDNKEKQLTSHGVCSKWILSNLKDVKMYLGWDGQIYPKFEMKTIKINN